MATQKWIPDPSWHICKVLHTLLVTSSDLCYLKSLYTAPLHEIDLALVIVTDKLHLTCFRSFASGTGIRQFALQVWVKAQMSIKSGVSKGGCSKAVLTVLIAFIYTPANALSTHVLKFSIPWIIPWKISILESLRKTKFIFQKLISGNEIALCNTVVALCLSIA